MKLFTKIETEPASGCPRDVLVDLSPLVAVLLSFVSVDEAAMVDLKWVLVEAAEEKTSPDQKAAVYFSPT